MSPKYKNFQAMPRSAFLTISYQMGSAEGGAIENSQWKRYNFSWKARARTTLILCVYGGWGRSAPQLGADNVKPPNIQHGRR